MTATLINTDGTKRIVLDGEIVVGEGLDFGPLPGAKAWIDARAGSGEGIGGYPAAYYQALENATGLLGVEHIEPGGEHGVLYVSGGLATWGLIMDANVATMAAIDWSKIVHPTTLAESGITDARELSNVDLTGYGDAVVDGLQVQSGQVDLSGASFPYLLLDSGAGTIPNLDASKLGGQAGSYYLALGNATGTLATAKGGTGADGSALPASRFLVSPTGGGAAAYRAMDPADIPAHTSALVSDFAAAARSSISILDGTNIDLSYNSSTGVISASITGTVAVGNGGTGLSALGAANTVLAVNSGATANAYTLIANANVSSSAAIAWSKLDKASSSLADLATRSAADLSSGNLAAARLPSASAVAWTLPAGGVLTVAGNVRLGDTGMALGNTIDATNGFRMTPSALTGTAQIGIFADPIFSSSATASGRAYHARVRTAAAAFTLADAAAFYVQNAGIGAGSAITTQVGLDVAALSGATTNIAIRTGNNTCIFGGPVTIGTDITLTSPTTATTATAGANTLPANPVGFLVVSIAGTSRKIPYYAT